MKGALTPTADVHVNGTDDPRRPNYSVFSIRYFPSSRRLGESNTHNEEVDDLDRIFCDHELLSGLQAAALRPIHAPLLERSPGLQERRRALQRLPALNTSPECLPAQLGLGGNIVKRNTYSRVHECQKPAVGCLLQGDLDGVHPFRPSSYVRCSSGTHKKEKKRTGFVQVACQRRRVRAVKCPYPRAWRQEYRGRP